MGEVYLSGNSLEERLEMADVIVNDARRKVNTILLDFIEDRIKLHNPEDLKRLLSQLERAHEHLVTALLSDLDIYCVLKHLSAAEGLINELTDIPEYKEIGKQIVGALGYISNGKLKPCSACKSDRKDT